MKSLVTLGTFDGLHLGHQALLGMLKRTARRLRLKPHVVLFGRPPRFFFRPELAMPLLTTEAERVRSIRDAGIRRVTVLRFNAGIARLPHARFFEEFLLRRSSAGGFLVGSDFAFGRNRLGDTAWLKTACRERGLYCGVLPLLRAGKLKVSSSRVRERLLRGDVAGAARLLGRPYRVEGRVVHGRGLGGRLGIPTANLAIPDEKFAPRGVYQVRVLGRGLSPHGALGVCNVGTRPTVGGQKSISTEIHIPGFSGNLYGRDLRVEFIRRLRAERKFPSVAALVAQVRRDIRNALRRATV